MQSGKLRHKITIQKATETQDGYGQPKPTWADFKILRAAINPIGSREYFQSRQINSEITHRITIRYTSGITQKMRIKYGTRFFKIESFMNVKEKNRKTHMLCVEETS